MKSSASDLHEHSHPKSTDLAGPIPESGRPTAASPRRSSFAILPAANALRDGAFFEGCRI
jgi:hypothetical protein